MSCSLDLNAHSASSDLSLACIKVKFKMLPCKSTRGLGGLTAHSKGLQALPICLFGDPEQCQWQLLMCEVYWMGPSFVRYRSDKTSCCCVI